jgi:hypothetical protein
MEFSQIETRPLREDDLDMMSGGRVCHQGPPRMEVSIQVGSDVLVIWAPPSCSGTYWHVK